MNFFSVFFGEGLVVFFVFFGEGIGNDFSFGSVVFVEEGINVFVVGV